MNTKAMLLVEDDRQDEKLTLRALRRVSLADNVTVVRDGQQALDYLFCRGEFAQREGTELPAVVLLDIGLPRLSGLEVLKSIRTDPRTAVLPVVVHTSSDDEGDKRDSYREGANSFIRKAVDSTSFAVTVALIGQYWLSANDPPELNQTGETLGCTLTAAPASSSVPACPKDSGEEKLPNVEQLAALADLAGKWHSNGLLSDSQLSAARSVEFLTLYLINHGNSYSLPAGLTESTWNLACNLCTRLETFAKAGCRCPFGLSDPCHG